MIEYPNIDPIMLQIGKISIHWYGISYIVSAIFAIFYTSIISKNTNSILEKKIITLDIVTYICIGLVVGGRIGHVIIYDIEYFRQNFLEIFQIWKGGMSFHGGLIGGAVGNYIAAKKYQVSFLHLSDRFSCSIPFGIFLGRIANFINAELYGKTTNISWGMIFPGSDNLARHPTQIYEALTEGFLLFIIVNCSWKINYIREKKGLTSYIFIIGYGIFRFILEYFKEPNYKSIFNSTFLTTGQFFSIAMLIFGFTMYAITHKKSK